MKPIIKVENLSKQYRLGVVGTGTLRNDLARWWARMRGKDDPFLKIGETNIRNTKGNSEYVWALRDINFEVQQGDVLGIIGKNGAGKSTLLKILSKVTGPTTGSIKYNGRIGSLLEVGTGFHPELTGRENIFLNGAILGMTKAEIRKKLDEIIDFAGVERYIDTPVKRYSSGMTVRLGFAVAAHLEPEILVVDEVLAVGDAEFQKKAIGKMQDVSKNDGRTVLFVSHNMAAVSKLCNNGILLEDGKLSQMNKIEKIVDAYLLDHQILNANYSTDIKNDKIAQILNVTLKNSKQEICNTFRNVDEIHIELLVFNTSKSKNIRCNISLWDAKDNVLMIDRILLEKNNNIFIKGIIPCSSFIPGYFKIGVSLDIFNYTVIEILERKIAFEIIDTGLDVLSFGDNENGIISSVAKWEIQ